MRLQNRIKGFVGVGLLGAVLMGSVALATDFSKMSTDELANLRGTICSQSPDECNQFRQEWHKRMASMTPEERAKYMASCPGCNRGMKGKGMNGRGMMGRHGNCNRGCMNYQGN